MVKIELRKGSHSRDAHCSTIPNLMIINYNLILIKLTNLFLLVAAKLSNGVWLFAEVQRRDFKP